MSDVEPRNTLRTRTRKFRSRQGKFSGSELPHGGGRDRTRVSELPSVAVSELSTWNARQRLQNIDGVPTLGVVKRPSFRD